MEDVLSALNKLKTAKLGKDYDDTIKQLTRFSKKLTLSTLPSDAVNDATTLLRNKLAHTYSKSLTGLQFSSALLGFLCSAKLKKTDVGLDVWNSIASSLLSGVVDFLEDADKNVKKERQRNVSMTHTPTLLSHFFVSPTQPTLSLNGHLLSTGYQVLFQVADGNAQTPTNLRKEIGGRRLGHTLTKLQEFLAIESLLNLVAALIPPRKKGVEKRNEFIDELFAPTIFPSGLKISAMLKQDDTVEWETIANKIVQYLAEDDIARPQPFDLANLRVNNEKCFHVTPSYIDQKGFLINIEKDDKLETLDVPFSGLQKVTATQTNADRISVALVLDRPPMMGTQACVPSEGDTATVSWELKRDHLAKFKKVVGVRGLDFRMSGHPIKKVSTATEEVDLGFNLSGSGLDNPVAAQVKKLSQTWASSKNDAHDAPTSSPLRAASPLPHSAIRKEVEIPDSPLSSLRSPPPEIPPSPSPPVKACHRYSTRPNGGARRKLIVESDEEDVDSPIKPLPAKAEMQAHLPAEGASHALSLASPSLRPGMVKRSPQEPLGLSGPVSPCKPPKFKPSVQSAIDKEETPFAPAAAPITGKKRKIEKLPMEVAIVPGDRSAKRARSKSVEERPIVEVPPEPVSLLGPPTVTKSNKSSLTIKGLQQAAHRRSPASAAKSAPMKEGNVRKCDKNLQEPIVISDGEESPKPMQARRPQGKREDLPWMAKEFAPKPAAPRSEAEVESAVPQPLVEPTATAKADVSSLPVAATATARVRSPPEIRVEGIKKEEELKDVLFVEDDPLVPDVPFPETPYEPSKRIATQRVTISERKVRYREASDSDAPLLQHSVASAIRDSGKIVIQHRQSPKDQSARSRRIDFTTAAPVKQPVAQARLSVRHRGFLPEEEIMPATPTPKRPRSPELPAIDRIAQVLDELNEVILERIAAPSVEARHHLSIGQQLLLSETKKRMEDMFKESAGQFNMLIDLEREYVTKIDDLTAAVSNIIRAGSDVHQVFKQVIDHHNRHGLTKRAPKSLIPPLPSILRKA